MNAKPSFWERLLRAFDAFVEAPLPEIICRQCLTSADEAVYYTTGEVKVMCERCGAIVLYHDSIAVERRPTSSATMPG